MSLKKILPVIALGLGAILLADCSPKTGKSTAADKPAGSTGTAAGAKDGKTIYTASCGKCHKLFEPAEKSVEKWNSVLPSMIHKARLSDEEGELVRAYVMANVKK